MKRRYFVNKWQETREYFLKMFGTITYQDYELLRDGKTVERNGNYFRIEDFGGI